MILEEGFAPQEYGVAIKKGNDELTAIGPSGTEKSTLLRCIDMLEPPTAGTIVFDGQVITAKDCDMNKMRLKLFHYQITSRDFDFIGLIGALEEFGRKQVLSQRKINALQVVFEELFMQTLLPRLPQKFQMDFTVEYAESTGNIEARFVYDGKDLDPTKLMEKIPQELVKISQRTLLFLMPMVKTT